MIKFGIVGLGRIGKVHLLNVQRYCDNAQIVAACPVHSEHLDFLQMQGVTEHFDSFDQMLEHADIDAVIIASPTAFHFEHIVKAARAKKHIFCEKPIDLNFEKVNEIVSIVEASGIKFMLGFNRRFDPHVMQLKASIEAGKAGAARILKISSRDPAPPPIEFVKHSGGLFLDMSIHDFDMSRYLVGGEVKEVIAHGAVFGDVPLQDYDDIDTAVITLVFENGCMVQIDNSRYNSYGYDQRIEYFGEKGSISTQNLKENEVLIADKDGYHTAKARHFFIERYEESYRNIMIDFVNHLDRGSSPTVTANDGLKALKIALAVKQSFKEKRAVQL